MRCRGGECGASYPVLDGIPILINEDSSVFRIDDLVASFQSDGESAFGAVQALKSLLRRIEPSISRNRNAPANYARFTALVKERSERPRVLIVGGQVVGSGMDALVLDPSICLVETDVGMGDRTQAIVDAHDIAFADGSFDGVIAQAVLEHVMDPRRCVEEIHRVLAHGGIIYSETPFMQQVHEGRYDFTRFTHLGHRRLRRHFEEIDSGPAGGPGMALAWSWRYFLASFWRPGLGRSLATSFAHWTGFWLKYLDGFLIDLPGSYDSAAGYYFLGRRTEQAIADQEILRGYRGCG